MNTTLLFTSPHEIETELLCVFAVDTNTAKDAKPEVALLSTEEALTGAIEAVLSGGEFKADANETLLLHSPAGLKAKRLLVIGLGKAAKVTPHDARKGAGTAVRFCKPRGIRELAIAAPVSESLPAALTFRALAEGAVLADVDTDTYRSDRKDRSVHSVVVVASESGDQAAPEAGFAEGLAIGEAQNFTRDLVNEPGNILTPTVLGQRAAAMCNEQGLQCEVYSTDKLHELKMGAFWAVSQGSEEPPALIVMTYEPPPRRTGSPGTPEPEGGATKDGPVLGLVGKGITFDTGGISIKPADSMEKMKYDMAGAAAMIGAMQAIAQLKPAVKVIGVVCSAENMPSGKAYKPGDVEIAMSGKSIEVINTDAEGRLVLADGITYAKQLGATHLIDAATLTGACVVALGMINGGGFSNDDETWKHFDEGLKISGERFWRLPVEEDYRELIRSGIADIKNTGGRYGGAITAAMFLKEFAEETPWVHLDIAGLAWQDEAKPWLAPGPTGAAVRSIVEWVRSYGKDRV